ncbi:MAG: hypothetical protein CVT76_06480 [Alphaproteobacteria bacterium HGW-Alphaproteobacteria-15]|nr:MAG: hypothetical protein CVT76_06480 [Alphaproteobacteria bacterium HGW-Alphaproteobacteria-15]
MTDQPRIITDSKRDSLRARIEAAERRNAERSLADNARAAATAAADYTRAHPLAVIGGALAIGLAIGLLTRPGRRVVSNAAASATSGIKTMTARGGSQIGTLLGKAAVGYIMALIDDAVQTARAGQERAGELGDAASAQARKLKSGATQAAGAAAGKSRSLARDTRSKAGRMVNDLRTKTKR